MKQPLLPKAFAATLLLTAILFNACVYQPKGLKETFVLATDVEQITVDGKKILANSDSNYHFSAAALRTMEEAHSGSYSVMLTPKHPYALSVTLSDVPQDSYVEARVWKKGSEASIVAAINEVGFYKRHYKNPNENPNEWEELVLDFYVPPINPYNELKLFLWNFGQDTVYLDDFSISIKKSIERPEYKETAFHIELDTSDYLKLMKTRKRAFSAGVLQSKDSDWIKGFIIDSLHIMKAKMRLKGDWLDHLHGDKWSFRIKLKKANTWKHMKVFSFQNPLARLGVNEWLWHEFLFSQSVLATRYGFSPMTLNGRNLGIYAWEEHFAKQLIESQDKREGPILRFVENALWDTRVLNAEGKMNLKKTAVFESAPIMPFGASKIAESPVLSNQYIIAQNLMLQYKERKKPASDIFNLKALSVFYASTDVFLAKHSLIWHNQRFYYNPVLCKLEPIAYDGYSDIGLEMARNKSIYGLYDQAGTEFPSFAMMRALFEDTAFLRLYYNDLKIMSQEHYIDSVFAAYHDKTQYYDSLIQMEFPESHFFANEIKENAKRIRKDLPRLESQYHKLLEGQSTAAFELYQQKDFDSILPFSFAKNLVNVYKQKIAGDSCMLLIESYFPEEFYLIGTGSTAKRLNQAISPAIQLSASKNGLPVRDSVWIINDAASYLLYAPKDGYEYFGKEINPWPAPSLKNSPFQDLQQNYPFPDTNIFAEINGRKIFVKEGYTQINKPVFVPKGYEVIFTKGTHLDFIQQAMFISESPVFMHGTQEQEILIFSSDSSSNGFLVLQANKKSELQYVQFKDLNTLNYNGWTLTGAVSFYESEVSIERCNFIQNHCEDALNIIRSNFVVKNSYFSKIFADAFDSDFSKGLVESTRFSDIGNDAIDFSGSNILINNTRINRAMDKGISGGEGSTLSIKNTLITNSNIGLASKDLSELSVDSTTVDSCVYGIVLLQKKPEYGPAKMVLNNCIIEHTETEMLIEKGSEVFRDKKHIKGELKNVASYFYE